MNKTLSALFVGAAIAAAPMIYAQDASPSPSASPDNGNGQSGPGQHRPGGEHHFEPFSAHLLQDLRLTEDQKSQVKTIMESAKQQGHKPGEMKEVLQQIRAILTPDQQQLVDDFEKYAEDRAALRKQDGGQNGQAPQSSASPSPTP